MQLVYNSVNSENIILIYLFVIFASSNKSTSLFIMRFIYISVHNLRIDEPYDQKVNPQKIF